MIPTLPVQIACPKCGNKYTAQLNTIVDVGQDPQLKARLLSGQLNVVLCPACGAQGAVNAPLLYHDPEKELLLLFVPTALNLPLPERERLTGNMVNALMTALPPEARKGYFLNPRPILSMQSLLEEILKADGITKEMLEEQYAQSQLLQDLVAAADNEEQLHALIDQNKSKIDYAFLMTLTSTAEASAAGGQKQLSDRLFRVRDALVKRLSLTLPEPLPPDTPTVQVVDRFVATTDQQARWALVLYNRPLLDYAFFQELTNRIEKASPEEAEPLRNLRTDLLEMVEQVDRESQAVQEAKIKLLEQVLASTNPEQTLREHRDEVDVVFLTMLGSALRQATEDKNREMIAKLVAVNESVMALLQEDLPPQLRFVNELMVAEYPQASEKLLRERRADWDEQLLDILSELIADFEEQGRKDTAERLKNVRQQAEAMIKAAADQAPQA
jgi:hypothetical protein